MISEIKFGPWLPEQTDYKNPGLEVAKNCLPSPNGYRPVNAITATAATVSGTVIGARSFERTNGSIVVCVATTSDLYAIVGATANAASLSLSLAATDQVVFERYNDLIFATTKGGDTWYLTDIDSDTTFAAVSGNIPAANAIARVGDFLVMGDLADYDASDEPYRVRWSPFNNPAAADWTPDIATQTGSVPLDPQQGPVTAISGGSFGFVFQKNGVSRMSYVAGQAVFDFDLYEKNRGCIAPLSVARVGDVAYFLSYDGFFQTDGASVTSISRARVWEWFVDNAEQEYLDRITAAVDWENRTVIWFCTQVGTGSLTYNLQLYFNWETGNWSYAEQTAGFGVTTTRSAGTTLEDLATTYPDLDAMTISLDNNVFRASGRTLAAISGGALATFTGSPIAAELQTGSFQPEPGKRTFVRAVTPLIANEAENTEISVATRETMTKSFVTSQTATVGALGYAPFNTDGRYFRVNVQIPAGQEWSDSYGLQLDYSVSGAF